MGNSVHLRCSISLLLDSLQEAELQRRTANGAHIEIIDRSLKAHEARLTNVHTLFYGNITIALADHLFQSENIHYYRNKREIALRKINLLINRQGENTFNIARSTAISKIHLPILLYVYTLILIFYLNR